MTDIITRLRRNHPSDRRLTEDAIKEIQRLRRSQRSDMECCVCGKNPLNLASRKIDEGAEYYCWPECWEARRG